MDNLLLLLPLAISVSHCLVSACLFRRINNRVNLLEEKISTLYLPVYPPPPPPVIQPSSYYNSPPGYGQPYIYSGPQGNLNVV